MDGRERAGVGGPTLYVDILHIPVRDAQAWCHQQTRQNQCVQNPTTHPLPTGPPRLPSTEWKFPSVYLRRTDDGSHQEHGGTASCLQSPSAWVLGCCIILWVWRLISALRANSATRSASGLSVAGITPCPGTGTLTPRRSRLTARCVDAGLRRTQCISNVAFDVGVPATPCHGNWNTGSMDIHFPVTGVSEVKHPPIDCSRRTWRAPG